VAPEPLSAPRPASTPLAPPLPAGGQAPGAAPRAGAPIGPAAAKLARAGAALLDGAPERAAIILALALRADRAAAEAVLAALDAVEPQPAHAAALAFVRAEALRAAGRHDESRIAYASAERLALAPAETGTPRSSQ